MNKHKLLIVETVKYNRHFYFEIEDLWFVLHFSLNMAQNCQVDVEALDKIPSVTSTPWVSFF